MASRMRFKGGEILHILRRSDNARGADNGEKDSDGLLSLFTLLTFLHSVSATGGLGGKRSGEVVGENHFYFRLDSSPVPPSPGCWTGQLAVYTAAAILAGQLFPYIVVKSLILPPPFGPGFTQTRCAHSADGRQASWSDFLRPVREGLVLLRMYEREPAGTALGVSQLRHDYGNL